MTIRVKLDDYVVNNDYSKPGISTAQQIMDDKRLCLLKLTDSDGHVQYLPIKQYNAIIVPMRDNEYNKASFGMSRRDFGAKVAKDGTFVEGEKHPVFQWGLTNTIYQFIYDEPWVSIPNNSIKENKYNGVKLFQRAHHGYNYGTGGASSLGSDTWTKGCLLFETSGANSFNRGRISKKSILPCWFVPAVEQGKAISDFVLRKNFTNEEIDAILNLKRDTQYWSLSIEGATIGVGTHVTYAFYPTKSNPKDDDDIKTQVFVRDNKFPVRLIRHLDDEMSEQLEHAPENYTGN